MKGSRQERKETRKGFIKDRRKRYIYIYIVRKCPTEGDRRRQKKETDYKLNIITDDRDKGGKTDRGQTVRDEGRNCLYI